MAKEVIGGEVVIEYKSVGELRKAIKEATGDVIKMQQQFGATSKEALAAAKRVAELKDRVKEAGEVAALFDPGNKFKAIGNAVTGLAGGFTALTGAMGVLGIKSEDTEKALLRVQSALALTQGLSTIADAGKDFGRLASIIKGPVIAAFTTLRGAFMALGIGLITSAIAFLITNFEKVKNVIYDLFPATKGLFDNMDRIKQIAMGVGNAILKFVLAPAKALIKLVQGDFQGALDAVKESIQFTKNFREGESKEIKSQADEREAARQEELRKEREKNKGKLEEQRRAAAEREKERAAERERIRKEEEEEDRQRLIRMWKAAVERMEMFKKVRNDISTEEDFGREERRTREAESYAKWLEDRKAQREKEKQLELDYNHALKQAEIDLQNAKFEAASAGLNLLASLAGKNKALQNTLFALDRGLAIAKVVIDTQKEIAGYYSNPTWSLLPDGGLALKSAAALKAKIRAGVSIATIAAASIQKFMNGASAGAGNAGGGGGGVSPLTPALSPQAQATSLNAAAINNLGNNAIRAYILNADIQNQNQINDILKRNSTI
jgi:hypothetical protein